MSKYDALEKEIESKRSMARYLRNLAAGYIENAERYEREAASLGKFLEPDTSDDYKRRRYLERHYGLFS